MKYKHINSNSYRQLALLIHSEQNKHFIDSIILPIINIVLMVTRTNKIRLLKLYERTRNIPFIDVVEMI